VVRKEKITRPEGGGGTLSDGEEKEHLIGVTLKVPRMAHIRALYFLWVLKKSNKRQAKDSEADSAVQELPGKGNSISQASKETRGRSRTEPDAGPKRRKQKTKGAIFSADKGGERNLQNKTDLGRERTLL